MFKTLEIRSARSKLKRHPLFSEVNTEEDLAILMEHVIFDMYVQGRLLKRLHLSFVNNEEYLWRPEISPYTSVMKSLNILMLNEVGGSRYSHKGMSRFENYLQLAETLNCDTQPLKSYVARLVSGDPSFTAITADIDLEVPFNKKGITKFLNGKHSILMFQDRGYQLANYLYGGHRILLNGLKTIAARLNNVALTELVNKDLGLVSDPLWSPLDYLLTEMHRTLEIDPNHLEHLLLNMYKLYEEMLNDILLRIRFKGQFKSKEQDHGKLSKSNIRHPNVA